MGTAGGIAALALDSRHRERSRKSARWPWRCLPAFGPRTQNQPRVPAIFQLLVIMSLSRIVDHVECTAHACSIKKQQAKPPKIETDAS